MEYFLKIGEVCRLYGITPDTLRHYEKKGLIHPWRDPASGYRYYSVAQLDVIDLILAAKTIGIPLAEIRRVIASEDVASYRAMYETQQRLLEEKIASLTKLLAITKEKRETLHALAAYQKNEPESLAETVTLYLIDVETLFAIESDPTELEGMETLSTWRVFRRDAAGIVSEDEAVVGFSFANTAEPTALEQGFRALVASGQCAVKKLPPEFFAQRFWGNDAALIDCLTARREALFYVRTRYSLLRGDDRHEHFVDIFVPASSSLS